MKENYEDLLSALRGELEEHRNERDNLRDEVVPQLRARMEGLESEASELQRLMYEHSRMQQEFLNLKNENASLASTLRNQSRQSRRYSQPPSGYATPTTPPVTFKDKETLVEKVKDIEEQRDALHAALKSLRERQKYESKKAKDRIKALEAERDKALQTQSNRRYGKDREMKTLRREMDRLRQRADDALEQKFMCERGLGTLKMDLEKAEQETSSLRVLLQEHDALVSKHTELQDSHTRLSMQVSQLKQEISGEGASMSLQQAYRDLQEIHTRTLARLGQVEADGSDIYSDLADRERRLSEAHEESQRAIAKLRQSVAQAEAERDSAQVEAEAYRKRSESLQQAEVKQIAEERSIGMQLKLSTERIAELAAQVRVQLESNNALRERLADAIGRGEEEQKMSARRINELQGRLKELEDKLLDAQQQTEDAVARHEEEVKQMKETHTSQLRRLKASTLRSPPPKSPLLSPHLNSPKLQWTAVRRGSNGSIPDEVRVENLEKRVEELENALLQADNEMAEVVGKMNTAQIEVLELQSER